MAKVGEVLIQLILQTREADEEMEKTTENIKRGLTDVEKKSEQTSGIINRAFRAATLPLRTMLGLTGVLSRSFGRMAERFKRESESMLETGQELTIGLAGPFFAIGAAAIYAYSQTIKGAKAIDKLIKAFENALSVMAPMGEWLTRFAFELLPHLRAILSEINNWFMSLSENQRRWVTYLALALTAVGPLITVLGAYGYLLGLLGTTLAALLSPTAMFVYGIIAIGAALVYAYNKVAWFRDLVNTTWQQIRAIFEQTWNGIVARFQTYLGSIISWWNTHKAQVIPIIIGIWDFVSTIVVGTLQFLGAFILGALDFIANLWRQHGNELWNTIMTAYYFIHGVISRTLLAIQSWWQQHGQSIWTTVQSMYNRVSTTISTIISGILYFIRWILNTMGAWWARHGDEVVTTVLNFLNFLWGLFQPILSKIGAFVQYWINRLTWWWEKHGENVTDAVGTLMDFIWGAFKTLLEVIKPILKLLFAIVESVWSDIENVISGALDFILGLVAAFSALLKGDWTKFWDAIKQAVAGALNVIWGLINLWLVGKVVRLVSTFGAAIVKLFSRYWNQIVNIVKNFGSRLLSSVKNTWTNVNKTINNNILRIVAYAYRWGRNLIDNFISGIKSMFGRLRSIVQQGINIVRDFLGFSSPTKKGPGRKADEWPVNLIKAFASGMESKLPDLRRTAINVAQTISVVSEPASVATGTPAMPSTLNGPIVQIQQAVIRNEEDIRRLAEQVAREFRRMWDDYNAARGL